MLSGLVPLLYSRCAPHQRLPSVPGLPKSAEVHGTTSWAGTTGTRGISKGCASRSGFFQKAIDEDPQYAPAFVGLADAYSMLGDHTGQTSGEYRQQAYAAVMQALEIDDKLAEAHATLGYLRMRNWQWQRRRSVNSNAPSRSIRITRPRTSGTRYSSSFNGRPDEAVAEATRAQELDPLSPIIHESLASRLYFARRYERAVQQLRRTIEIQPSFQDARETLSMVYVQTGRIDDALAIAPSGYAFARSGQVAKARAALAVLEHKDPVESARIQFALGERELALQSLERAFAQHADHLAFIKVDPAWDGLRFEPRFRAIVRQIGL